MSVPSSLRWGLSAATCLAVLIAVAPARATTWSLSQTTRAAEGCNENRDTSVCLLVRCDEPRRLALYFRVVEGDPFGNKVGITIDGRHFAARVAAPVVHEWGAAYAIRTTTLEFIAALRQGRRLTLTGAEITGGFDRFGLNGARAAIDRTSVACGLAPAK